MRHAFSKMDQDSDGLVSLEEFVEPLDFRNGHGIGPTRLRALLELRPIPQEETELPGLLHRGVDDLDVLVRQRAVSGLRGVVIALLTELPPEFYDEIVLGGEVVSQVSLGDADTRRDLSKRGCGIPPLVEEPSAGFEDSFSCGPTVAP